MNKEDAQRVLSALENSVDMVEADCGIYAKRWENVPTRAAQLGAIRNTADAHIAAIAIKQAEVADHAAREQALTDVAAMSQEMELYDMPVGMVEPDAWQPIEALSKFDGVVLLWNETANTKYPAKSYRIGHPLLENTMNCTHWMKLPKSPTK